MVARLGVLLLGVVAHVGSSVGLATEATAAGQEAGAAFGELQAVCLARWVSIAACLLWFVGRRERPLVPIRWWPVLAAQGLLDGGAYLALVSASEGAGSAIVAVLASTFSAVVVVLARVVLREHISALQWGGIALILLGVGTLSALQA